MKEAKEFITGITRPLAVLLILFATVAMIFAKVGIPEQWWGMAGTVLGAWFIARSLEKKKDL